MSQKPKTVLAHNGRPADGPVNRPVHRGSTVTFRSLDALKAETKRADLRDANRYGRVGNVNSRDFEQIMCALEGGDRPAYGAVTASSGLGAIVTALLAFSKPGSHVLMTDTVYSPVRHFCDDRLRTFGVDVEYYDPVIGAGIESLLRPETCVVYMESPGSKSFEVQDVPAIAEAAKKRGITTMIDNTWATPLFFKPLHHGVDIALHAATKYIGGHSDLFLGVGVCADKKHYDALKSCAVQTGQCAAPDDIVLALRGLRTLDARLLRQQESTRLVIDSLRDRPEIERILYPAEPGSPGHDLWRRDFTGASGLFTIVLKPVETDALRRFTDGLEYFPLGYSWGGYESLMVPMDMAEDRTVRPLTGRGLRISIGLEDPSDLIADLDAGFKRMKG